MSENAIVKYEPDRNVQIGSINADGPLGVIATGTIVANEITRLVKKAGLVKKISGRDYVACEGWTTAAAMLGVTAREVSVHEDEASGDIIATVELVRTRDGVVLGRASALLGSDEKTWSSRPRFARRSMAVTRATGKACRLAFSWFMTLAGFQPTPAEEMDDPPASTSQQNSHSSAPVATRTAPPAAAPAAQVFEDRIVAVDQKTFARKPKEGKPQADGAYWLVTTANGTALSTFSQTLRESAEGAMAEEVPVEIHWQADGKFKKLIEIYPAKENQVHEGELVNGQA